MTSGFFSFLYLLCSKKFFLSKRPHSFGALLSKHRCYDDMRIYLLATIATICCQSTCTRNSHINYTFNALSPFLRLWLWGAHVLTTTAQIVYYYHIQFLKTTILIDYLFNTQCISQYTFVYTDLISEKNWERRQRRYMKTRRESDQSGSNNHFLKWWRMNQW